MTEQGGPATQAGIRYQNQVAALYLGRMLDPTTRPQQAQPVEVRLEAPVDVDDFSVKFADGSRRYFQVKISLNKNGKPWNALWHAFRSQLANMSPEDRIVLILGEPSALGNNLRNLAERTEDSDVAEWRKRLTAPQQALASSIGTLLNETENEVWQLFCRLNVTVYPVEGIETDQVPLWMPTSSVPRENLFRALTEMASEGAKVRARFDGASLYDRLRHEPGIIISDPSRWGSSKYREAIASLSTIEVPGTGFQRAADSGYLWPRCFRFDRDRQADFDDDMPGWRDLTASTAISLRDFPSVDLNAVVVVAGPGFGKTTLVNAIAREATLSGLLPAIVPITKLSEADLSISDYLSQIVNSEFDVQIDWRAAAAGGSLVLLLDGLDEVSSDRRSIILERLRVYRASNPAVRWLLTVRDAAALAIPDGAIPVELAQLQDEDILAYVNFYRPNEPGLADALVNRIASQPDLAHLVRIPIFLALLLVMRQENEDLNRSDLLDTYLATLFNPAAFKSAEADCIDTSLLRKIAERAAFVSLEKDEIGVTAKQLNQCAQDLSPSTRTDDVREALVRRGVLRSTGLARKTFPFPIVQEYLASAELLEREDEELAQRLAMIARRPWAQAIQFALERHPDPKHLIAQILQREDDVFHTGLRLVGRCLANGMAVGSSQRQEIGDRLADIWGQSSWRSNRLVSGIIVDAFSNPLHSAVRAKLGNRRLLHDGADVILSRLQDSDLSISVLSELLEGDIENLLNLGEFQREVDRLGIRAFELYISRCRHAENSEDEDAISALIGHMKLTSVDDAVAHEAAIDDTLPLTVRLAAWSHVDRVPGPEVETLMLEGMKADSYLPMAAAAQALSSAKMDLPRIIALLQSPELPAGKASKILDYLIGDWRSQNRFYLVHSLLDTSELSDELRDLASLYAVEDGNMAALDALLDKMPTMSLDMVCATVSLFGHVLERPRVQSAIDAISGRKWCAKDRFAIANAFSTGLTYRMEMFGMRSGALKPIPPHPGRTLVYPMLEAWLTLEDYNPRDLLAFKLEAIRLGVPSAADGLRATFDAAMAAPPRDEHTDGMLAGRALEVLHDNNEGLERAELERLASSSTYNLASSAVRQIATRGTQADADTLMELFETVKSNMLRAVILDSLEPLAGRLGLRITRKGKALSATKI